MLGIQTGRDRKLWNHCPSTDYDRGVDQKSPKAMIAFKLGSSSQSADGVCFSLMVPQGPHSATCPMSSPVRPLTAPEPARDSLLARQLSPCFEE